MRWRLYGYIMLFSALIFFYGSTHTLAQDSLVPAGRDGDFGPDGYGICEFVDLVNNVILFIIGLLGMIAVLVFMWAGFLMVTSRGTAEQLAKAKSLFANVLIGGVIMFAAYLIVNTVLSILLSSVSGSLNWTTVSCSYANAPGGTIDSLVLANDNYVSLFEPTVVGDMPSAFPSSSGGGGTGGGVSGTCNASGLQTGAACYAQNRCLINVSSGACTAVSAYEPLIQAAASRYGVSADDLRGIMITESGGNPSARSPVGAIGLMQVMPDTGRSACGVSASQLLDPATNVDCGARYYASMLQRFGDRVLAIAAYNAGPGGNQPSRDCPGLTRWQCPYNSGGCCSSGTVTATNCAINTGYQETRTYVDKVNAAAPRCRR